VIIYDRHDEESEGKLPLWLLVNKQFLQESMDQFRRKGEWDIRAPEAMMFTSRALKRPILHQNFARTARTYQHLDARASG
jgi:hypothetical protein